MEEEEVDEEVKFVEEVRGKSKKEEMEEVAKKGVSRTGASMGTRGKTGASMGTRGKRKGLI